MLPGNPAKRSRILVACMPKSGSTFLTTAISSIGRYKRVPLVPAYGRREQELCEVELRKRWLDRYVAHHHVKYNEHTARMISKYQLVPVVLERNFFDVLVSLRDHVRNAPHKVPVAYVRQEDVLKSDEELEVMLAHVAMPWYMNFALSWRETENVLFLNYNGLMNDKADTLRRVFDYAGCPVDQDQIEPALASVSGSATRLNFGVPGRGKHLSDDAKEAVLRLINVYGRSSFDSALCECD